MKRLPFQDCMTVAEAAEILKLSGPRVTVFCEEGRLEGAFKFGFMWAIPRKAVAAFAKIERPAAGRVANPAGRPPQKS